MSRPLQGPWLSPRESGWTGSGVGLSLMSSWLISIRKAFKGVRELYTTQHVQEGRRALPFDITHDPANMDLLTDRGFANALYHTMALLPGSGALSAPVCSTFVVVCLACMGDLTDPVSKGKPSPFDKPSAKSPGRAAQRGGPGKSRWAALIPRLSTMETPWQRGRSCSCFCVPARASGGCWNNRHLAAWNGSLCSKT